MREGSRGQGQRDSFGLHGDFSIIAHSLPAGLHGETQTRHSAASPSSPTRTATCNEDGC